MGEEIVVPVRIPNKTPLKPCPATTSLLPFSQLVLGSLPLEQQEKHPTAHESVNGLHWGTDFTGTTGAILTSRRKLTDLRLPDSLGRKRATGGDTSPATHRPGTPPQELLLFLTPPTSSGAHIPTPGILLPPQDAQESRQPGYVKPPPFSEMCKKGLQDCSVSLNSLQRLHHAVFMFMIGA